MENNNVLQTVAQFCRPNQWPSQNSLRALILGANRGENAFAPAFKKVGRRVLVAPEVFWKIVRKGQFDAPIKRRKNGK